MRILVVFFFTLTVIAMTGCSVVTSSTETPAYFQLSDKDVDAAYFEDYQARHDGARPTAELDHHHKSMKYDTNGVWSVKFSVFLLGLNACLFL
ncbi:Hypothetical protein NTJ_11779 [Nesidiocoris tenuis]|uniref:Cathepsin propeptide inhibitor domain-containing protein n=1 Tax=Nesidiocoris tenuis TaxID=355587 RepID=A0ABN7B3Y4_9HEMI|nr:Hypothetical protein NTJ_11779 [Nesidiocoris tenuis]